MMDPLKAVQVIRETRNQRSSSLNVSGHRQRLSSDRTQLKHSN